MTHRACRGVTILVSLVGLAAGSCSKPTTQDRANPPPPSTTPGAPTADTGADACTLLTKEEIQAGQGEGFKDTQLRQKIGAGPAVSQCYFGFPIAGSTL